jgi:hypothetical protein
MSTVDLRSPAKQLTYEKQSMVAGAASSHTILDRWAAHSVNS